MFSLLIGPVGYYIRSHLDETPEFIANRAQTKVSEPGASFSNQWANLVLAIGIVAQSTVGVYVLQLLDRGLQFIFSPLMGALSDKLGRIRIMLGTSIFMGVAIYPMFAWL